MKLLAPDCRGALVLSREYHCVTSDFALRCSALSLSSTALAADSEDRASARQVLGHAKLWHVFLSLRLNKDQILGIMSYAVLCLPATYPKPRMSLATSVPVFHALFLEVLEILDTCGFKLVLLSVLLHFTHPVPIIKHHSYCQACCCRKHTGAIGLPHPIEWGLTLDCMMFRRIIL